MVDDMGRMRRDNSEILVVAYGESYPKLFWQGGYHKWGTVTGGVNVYFGCSCNIINDF